MTKAYHKRFREDVRNMIIEETMEKGLRDVLLDVDKQKLIGFYLSYEKEASQERLIFGDRQYFNVIGNLLRELNKYLGRTPEEWLHFYFSFQEFKNGRDTFTKYFLK